MNKNILVTGGAGFIGSHLVDALIVRGYKISILDSLTYAGDLNNLQLSKVNFYKGDINNADLVNFILKKDSVDVLINCAAETHVDNSILNPNIFAETNIMGTLNLLRCSLDYKNYANENFLFVQMSTDEVYGALDETGYFSEKTPISPRSPYSASKAAADHMVSAFNETYGLSTIITRCSNNFGERQHKEKLIPKTINCLKNKTSIPVYGNGKNIRDWISVKDHCLGVVAAIEKGAPGEIYCLGGNCELSNINVVKLILEKWNELFSEDLSHLIKFVDDRLGHDFRYAVDFSYAAEVLNFSPKYSLDKEIENMINTAIGSKEGLDIA